MAKATGLGRKMQAGLANAQAQSVAQQSLRHQYKQALQLDSRQTNADCATKSHLTSRSQSGA